MVDRDAERLLARYERALRLIANINNGPDRASGEWRCLEAARIAEDALKQSQPPAGGE